jgi:hypothetical protein
MPSSVDQLVDVGIDHHGDDRIRVAEAAGHGDHRHPLGDQPGGVGVTEIVEVQPAILGPQMR